MSKESENKFEKLQDNKIEEEKLEEVSGGSMDPFIVGENSKPYPGGLFGSGSQGKK